MKSHEAQQTFSFPMLKNSEILSTWEDVPLQGKDLEKPTAISVRAVYEALCEQCIGPCAREDIYNPVEGAMGRIEIPELHEESIQQLTFFKYVSKLLSAAGVNDFSLEDITKPDAKRFRRNLCAIINFQKFRMQCIGDFEDLHSEGQQVMEKCLELDEDIATIEENIQNVQEERQAEQPQIEKIQEECRLLDGDIAKSSGEKDALEYEFKQLKIKNEELKDYMNSLKKQKQEIKDKILLMNENVIRSPERLKGELSSQKSQLESEQETRQKLITAKEELKEKINQLEKSEMKSNDILNLIEKVQVGMNECKEAVKKTKEMSISKKEHNNTMRQLQTEKKEAENQIKISEDRLDHLSKTKSLKDAAATHALNEAVSDLDILKQKKIEMKQTFEKRKDEIELLKTKLSNLKIQGKENIEKRRLALKRLDNIAESSSETLMERIAISGV